MLYLKRIRTIYVEQWIEITLFSMSTPIWQNPFHYKIYVATRRPQMSLRPLSFLQKSGDPLEKVIHQDGSRLLLKHIDWWRTKKETATINFNLCITINIVYIKYVCTVEWTLNCTECNARNETTNTLHGSSVYTCIQLSWQVYLISLQTTSFPWTFNDDSIAFWINIGHHLLLC